MNDLDDFEEILSPRVVTAKPRPASLGPPLLLGTGIRDILNYGNRLSFLHAYGHKAQRELQRHSRWLQDVREDLALCRFRRRN